MNRIGLEQSIEVCEAKVIRLSKRRYELTKQIASADRELQETHNQLKSLEQAYDAELVRLAKAENQIRQVKTA